MQISIKSSNNFFLNTLSLEATFFLRDWSLVLTSTEGSRLWRCSNISQTLAYDLFVFTSDWMLVFIC